MIPIHLYTPIYYYVILFFVMITFIHTQTVRMGGVNNLNYTKISGVMLLLFVVLYMGLRPIHGVFVDMMTYNYQFVRCQVGDIPSGNDYLFNYFILLSSKVLSGAQFFFICAFIYVFPAYLVSKKWFGNQWFYAFLIVVASFSFWSYGTNGIRNGMATSMFLMGMSKDKRVSQAIWLLISVLFHKAMMLPAAGFILSNLFNKPRLFLIFWLLSIPLSLIGGGFWEQIFSNSPIEDSRFDYFTAEVDESKFSKIGFRWDFLLYSSVGVGLGWYYIFKRKFSDQLYYYIFNTYLFANAIWILVIRANFSNRFAYLSWFLLPLVLIYPPLKTWVFRKNHQSIGLMILLYFAFTFIINVVLK